MQLNYKHNKNKNETTSLNCSKTTIKTGMETKSQESVAGAGDDAGAGVSESEPWSTQS